MMLETHIACVDRAENIDKSPPPALKSSAFWLPILTPRGHPHLKRPLRIGPEGRAVDSVPRSGINIAFFMYGPSGPVFRKPVRDAVLIGSSNR